MFSDRFYFLASKYTPACGILGVVPFGWNGPQRQFSFCASSKKRLAYNYLFIILWEIFFVLQSIRYKRSGEIDNFNLIYAFTAATALPLLTGSSLLYFAQDLVSAMNTYMRFLHHLDDLYQPHIDRNKSKLGIIVDLGCIIIMGGMVFTAAAVVATLLLFPDAPMFWGNVFRPNYLVLKLAMFVCQIHTVLVIYLNVGFLILMIFIYGIQIFSLVMTEFRLDIKKHRTTDEFREFGKLQINYRAFQILQDYIMGIFGYMLLPNHLIVVKMVIFGNFTLIRQYNELKPISILILSMWSFMASLFWAFVLSIGGFLYNSSRKTFYSWKIHKWGSKGEAKIISKFRKSCRPILLSWNSIKIKRLTVLKFFRQVSKGTFRALITLKKR